MTSIRCSMSGEHAGDGSRLTAGVLYDSGCMELGIGMLINDTTWLR